jgi:cobalt-zinc-cadmium efflux system outer membrane protein
VANHLAFGNLVAPAGALPDPVLEVMYRQEGRPWAPMTAGTMSEVALTQMLPFPGKLAARRRAAQADATVAEARIWELRLDLILLVRQSYGKIYALDKEQEILQAASEMVELLEAAARARYSTGQGEQEAVLKAQLEKSHLVERLADLTAERRMQVATLGELLDERPVLRLGPVRKLPQVVLPPGRLEELVMTNCCLLATARAELKVAERRLDEARLETRPNFMLGLGAGSTFVPEPVFSVRFGVELPFWKSEKQLPQIAAYSQQLEAARQRLRAREAQVLAELARLRAQWERDEQQILLYREGIVPQAELALEAAQAAYLAGKGDFATVAEDYRLWLQAQIDLVRLEAQRFQTWAHLDELLTPVPPSAAISGEVTK